NAVSYEYLVSGTKHNVPDQQLNASSQLGASFAAKWGRLNTVYVKGEHIGGWEADNTRPPHYIGVRFNELSIIHAIATQGRNVTGDSATTKCYVTKYYVYYRPNETDKWIGVRGGPEQKLMLFEGNNDSNSIRTNKLPSAVQASAVRILVNESIGSPSMRFDVLGCPVSQGIYKPGFITFWVLSVSNYLLYFAYILILGCLLFRTSIATTPRGPDTSSACCVAQNRKVWRVGGPITYRKKVVLNAAERRFGNPLNKPM
ncbi:hypothetical protein ACJMK2_025160, partial [Sinanodonta woodiana]